jgi:hypothetical protein
MNGSDLVEVLKRLHFDDKAQLISIDRGVRDYLVRALQRR